MAIPKGTWSKSPCPQAKYRAGIRSKYGGTEATTDGYDRDDNDDKRDEDAAGDKPDDADDDLDERNGDDNDRDDGDEGDDDAGAADNTYNARAQAADDANTTEQ